MSQPRSSDRDAQGTAWVPLGIPLGSNGVDLRVAPRNRSRSALSELVNANFRDERVFGRRPGSSRWKVTDSDGFQVGDEGPARPLFGTGKWVYGHGHLTPDSAEHYPRAKTGRGTFVHGDQAVAWTGDRFIGHTGDNARPGFGEHLYWARSSAVTKARPDGVPGYAPAARHAFFADTTYDHYDTALGRRFRLLAFADSTTPTGVHAVVFSRETGQIVHRRDLQAGATPDGLRCVYSNGRLVVVWIDGGNLFISSASEEDPGNWSAATDIGNCATDFDLHYVDDGRFLLAWRDGANIKATWYRGETSQAVPFGAATNLGVSTTPTGALAVTVHPSGLLGVVYAVAASTRAQVLTAGGANISGDLEFIAGVSATRVAVAARWLDRDQDASTFVGYAYDASALKTKVARFTVAAVSTTDTREFFGCQPRSAAFRVGEETFCWLVAKPAGRGLQNTYHLVGGAHLARIVASSARGESIATAGTVLPSVHPDPLDAGPYGLIDEPTTRLWTCALPRDHTTVGAPNTLVAMLDLDFTPPLRWAPYGNAVYLAGALVQTYDGRDVVEAGWTQYPEVQSGASNATAGGLVAGQKHRYRVYVCWKNTAGETFRSPALTSDEFTVGGGHTSRALVFNAIPLTNKPVGDIYFEIYRTLDVGTTYYLVDRVRANSFAVATITYTDSVADTTLWTAASAREIDPHNPAVAGFSELEESAPPGCEIVVAHGDRLWFAGGEIAAGQLAHSKIREAGEGLGWSDLVGSVDIDVTGEPTTSLASAGEALVIFQRNRALMQGGFGPDNLGNGGFSAPLTVAATDGATVHDGTVATDVGVAYWSRGGPRLLTPGLQIVHIGAPVEPLARDLVPTGVVAVPGLREVRWYTEGGTALLWDHTPSDDPTGRWAVWTGLAAAGVALGATRPVIATPDGALLFEDAVRPEDGGAGDDGGYHFTLAWATSEIRPGELVQGRNSVLRVALTGRGFGPHTLRTWVYYDGSAGWDEFFTWTAAADLAITPWGLIDTAVSAMGVASSPDGVYRFERALRRNPCSTVRFRFDDGGAHGNTVEPHEVAVELGALTGIARTSPRTFPLSIPAPE